MFCLFQLKEQKNGIRKPQCLPAVASSPPWRSPQSITTTTLNGGCDVSDSDLPNRPYPSVSEDAVNSDEILEKDTPKSHSDENKNLLQLNVNEKGNIVKISVTNSVSPATEATSQSADEGERPDKTKGIFDVTKTSTNIAIAQYRLDYKSIQHTLTRREFLRRPPDLHLYLCYNTPFRNNVKLPYL